MEREDLMKLGTDPLSTYKQMYQVLFIRSNKEGKGREYSIYKNFDV